MMLALLDQWWLWLALAIGLLILELLAPGFIFLGFAVGAAVVGLLVALFGGVIGTVPVTLLIFAILSVVAWVVIRKLAGERKGQVKVWDTDINE
jgi:membrane protein implicated in regulation of membrane protease activity